MRFAPAMMAMALLATSFYDHGLVPNKDDLREAMHDGHRYARKLGGGSGGGLKNKAFCNDMAARALPPLLPIEDAIEAGLRSIPVYDEWRRTKNALKRQRKLMRNR